ncbi:hypothetical protein O181_025529 [Austropuccinia psidii MF-1]|uniref:Uncharacterized protein n=1 Tax=Austropuccinia psidii MF-1 TaxID=1389203 RepID=A0A9Q3H0Q9_9BASI|nr:hypothetical protein [Austropuccinia psidii MF-1]
MVHTRNRSNYSLQPEGCGQGRGKTKTRSFKSSSRKTHMEDARVSPIPQGLNHFQVAEIEISQCQYKNWFRAAKEEEWEICPNVWKRARNSYLHIQRFLGQEKTIELLGGWSPLSCKGKVTKIKNWLKKQSILSIDQKKELEMTPALETEGQVASTSSKHLQKCSKTSPKNLRRRRKVPRTIKERAKAKPIGTDLTHKGTGSPNWSLQLCKVSSIWPGLLWNSQPRSRKG